MAVISFTSSLFGSHSCLLKLTLCVSDDVTFPAATIKFRRRPQFRHFLSHISRDVSNSSRFIKMCRTTNGNDALISAKAGARYVETILRPRVRILLSKYAKEFGAEPVGAFVDEDAPTLSHLPRDRFPMVKMCGITNVNDAVIAAKAGAKYVGMILWPKSKRSVSVDLAKRIATAVKELGAEPVGVFVDEDAPTIKSICSATGITFAQLHGDIARSAILELPLSINVIYVLHADKHGAIQTALPERHEVDWILVDSLGGGSGKKFDWLNFQIPKVLGRNGWILAGGLEPQNVGGAISILKPHVVDVSSGITGPDGIIKDPLQIVAFMDAVWADI